MCGGVRFPGEENRAARHRRSELASRVRIAVLEADAAKYKSAGEVAKARAAAVAAQKEKDAAKAPS